MNKGSPKKRGEKQVPMCPLCETKHWSRDPHKFSGKK